MSVLPTGLYVLGIGVFLVLGFILIGAVRFMRLNKRADRFRRQKKYAEAERDYQKILLFWEKNQGRRNRLEAAKTLCNLALVYEQMRDDAKAEQVLRRALQIGETALGPEHPESAPVLEGLALIFQRRNNFAQAEALHLRALAIRENALGLEHAATANSLNNLARLYQAMGDYAKAESLYQRALKIREKIRGPEHPDTAASLNDLANLYRVMGKYPEAEPLYQRGLTIAEKVLGPEHPDTAAPLNNLAILYDLMCDYARAEPLFLRALKIWENARGPEHGTCMHNLGCHYFAMGDYGNAESWGQRSLKVTENVLGSEHPDTAQSLDNLAQLYHKMGTYGNAETLSQRALKIRENVLGSEHIETAGSLITLAAFYHTVGDYAKAEALYQRALKVVAKVLGTEHPHTATNLNNLAGLYEDIGDHIRAEPLFQRALEINEKTLGPEHPETTRAMRNLAGIHQGLGNYAKSEQFLQRAFEILNKALGPEHPETAACLHRLAVLYHNTTNYPKAEALYHQALQITEKVVGPEHPDTAYRLYGLARLYWAMENSAKAEPLFQRSQQILEKALGAAHPQTVIGQASLGHLLAEEGRQSEALPLARQALKGAVSLWANLLSFTSESQRLAFQATQKPYDLFATLCSAPDLALAVLRFKGLVLDSLLEDRLVAQASGHPEIRALVDQLHSLKLRLTQLVFEAPKDLSEPALQRREEEKKRLTQEAEQRESTIARHVAGLGRARRSLSVTVEQVQAAIPKEAVLLEWLRYGHCLGKNQAEMRYGVIVLCSSGEPQWVSLGNAEAIEKSIEQYRAAMRGSAGGSPSGNVDAAITQDLKSKIENRKSEIEAVLHRFHEQLWLPLEPFLPPATKTVIISPDGALNFLSFATLLTPDDQFLSEKYSIRYVASGRDLLREFQTSANARVTVFANPDFGGKGSTESPGDAMRSGSVLVVGARTPSSAVAAPHAERSDSPAADEGVRAPTVQLREMEIRDFADLHLPPLPGTAQESALLAAHAQKWNWPIEIFEQGNANKPQLRSIQSPRILHLATHGFFLADGGAHASRVLGSAPSPNPSAKPIHEHGFVPVGGAPTGAAEAAALPATVVEERRGVGGVRPLEPIEFGGEAASFLRPGRVLKNPMHRSGLALAGAQATLDAWRRGESASARDDGIVTAAEVGTLKLEGTELVVLSACETGVGEAKSGEGVLGLRRGFIQAGAQNLLMTIWSIADEETAQIMAEFYERFHATKNAPQALADVQRDWLMKLRKERGLEAAVVLAGPFILSSQGPLHG